LGVLFRKVRAPRSSGIKGVLYSPLEGCNLCEPSYPFTASFSRFAPPSVFLEVQGNRDSPSSVSWAPVCIFPLCLFTAIPESFFTHGHADHQAAPSSPPPTIFLSPPPPRWLKHPFFFPDQPFREIVIYFPPPLPPPIFFPFLLLSINVGCFPSVFFFCPLFWS